MGSEKRESDIIKDMYIFDFAEENNFEHIPQLLKTRWGKLFTKYESCFVYMVYFIEGKAPTNTPENRKKIGEITAKLHELKGYTYKTSFTVVSEQKHLEEVASKIPFGKEYAEIVKSLLDFSTCSQSVIHTDIWLHNILEDKHGSFFFIDRDDVGVGMTILDLWFPLSCQFQRDDGDFQEENAKAFYGAYFEKRDLWIEEKKMIFDAGLFFALIYFLYEDVDKNWKRM